MYNEYLQNIKISYIPYFNPIFTKCSMFCLNFNFFSTDESKSGPDFLYLFFFGGGGVACGNTFRYTFGMFSNTRQ